MFEIDANLAKAILIHLQVLPFKDVANDMTNLLAMQDKDGKTFREYLVANELNGK